MGSLNIKKLELGLMANNCYVLECKERSEGVIIDPGAEEEKVLKNCKGLRVQYILITHGHWDHTSAVEGVKEITHAPVAIHSADANQLPSPPDILLNDNDLIRFGRLELRVIHTPGHTPGGICLLINSHLFSGDTIFRGGYGNTAFPGGNYSALMKSICEKILVLPDTTIIYPGHGPKTTVAEEKYSGFYAFSPLL